MGNYYSIFCRTCKKRLFLGKENEFWCDKRLMYFLRDFILSHTGHHLCVSGDEWNSVSFDTSGYTNYDSKCSEEDYESEKEADK